MEFDEIVLSILDAALEPAQWPTALEKLAIWASVRSINLDTFDLRSSRGHVSVQYGFDPRYIDSYNADGTLPNPLVEAVKGTLRTGDIRRSSQILRREEYEGSEMFQMLLRPNGVKHIAGVTLEVSSEAIAYASFNKPDDAADFSDREIARLGQVQPWLKRAFAIHRQLMATQCRLSELTTLWDQVQQAVFLIDRQCGIHFANRAAETLLCWRDGVMARDGCLVLRHPESRAALVRALDVAGPLAKAAGVFRIRRSETEPNLAATLFPVSDELIGLLIIDPARGLEPAPDALRQLFELTAAEARLVLALVQGQSLKDYADAEGLVYSTARTHLKHAMAKNGWHRQSEMIAAIIRCLLPLGELKPR